MTITASQSGFTDVIGTVAQIVDGSDVTGWSFAAYTDNTGKTITFDMGGWFDGSTFSELFIQEGGLVGYIDQPAGGFGMRLSADGTNWYNMPDNTSSLDIGSANGTTSFTAMSGGFYFRYIQLVGTGGPTVYDPSSSYGQTYNTFDFRNGSGTAITVDTSGGANPNPPTGTPSTDPPPAPDPRTDSGAKADVNGVSLGVLRNDPASARVAGVSMGVLRNDNSTARVAGVSLGVLMLVVANTKTQQSFAKIIG